MYNAQRKALILDMLKSNSMVSVNDLSELLDISKETVRRDLKGLEEEGLVKRTHGGAMFLKRSEHNVEDPIAVRAIHQLEEKKKLCQKAAEMIVDGDTVFIDNSSTTLNILPYINPNLHVTVLTNSLRLLIESVHINNANLLLISSGGVFRPSNLSLTGTLADDWVQNFCPNKMFFSCHGVQPENGLTDGSIYEIDVKRAMIKNSQATYLLADYTKFGKQGVVFLSHFEEITQLITNKEVDPEIAQALLGRDVDLVTV